MISCAHKQILPVGAWRYWSICRATLMCALLAVITPVSAQETGGDVRIQQGNPPDPWAGQQVMINLDLMTNGVSFSDVFFNLPGVEGAWFIKTDSTTIKLTETIDGQNWQILRYPLALYAQQGGTLTIPSFEVRFKASAGFGTEPAAFRVLTQPVTVDIQWPSGAKQGSLIVTSKEFSLNHQWTYPDAPYQPGAAFTLNVERSVFDISGMLLPDLPIVDIEGLRAYPDAPVIKDTSNRGDLEGSRQDKVVWVAESAGDYQIPAIRFSWFDPDSEVLESQTIPGLNFTVDAGSDLTGPDSQEPIVFRSWARQVLILLAILAVFALLTRRYGQAWMSRLNTVLNRTQKSDAYARRIAMKAIHQGEPVKAYSAVTDWVVQNSKFSSLSKFARAQSDPEWLIECDALQTAVVNGATHWDGENLARCLRHFEESRRHRNTARSTALLPTINPDPSIGTQ